MPAQPLPTPVSAPISRAARLRTAAATLMLGMAAAAGAQPALTVTPITWDVVGLDSNKVTDGPDLFLIGVRVRNTGNQPATNLVADLNWTSSNSLINAEGLTQLTAEELEPGATKDFYYNVRITRNAAAYTTSRGYRVAVTADGLGTVQTPAGRQLYVERLISQNRNSTLAITGPTEVYVGETYTYVVDSQTATNGYEQLSSFLNFPNIIFNVVSVNQTYSAPAGATNDKVYADACGWDNNPASPTYLSCIGPQQYSGGKAGGRIRTTYRVHIGSTGTANVTNIIYDFSGSSFHYNGDLGTTIASRTITAVQGTAALNGTVWGDANFNGIINGGESRFTNVTVQLIRPGEDEIFGTADDILVDEVETNANGQYSFTGLAPKTFQIRVEDSAADIGAGYTLSTGTNPRTVTLSQGQTATEDFGYGIPSLGITKTSNAPASIGPNQTIAYNLAVTNQTTSEITGVSLSDPLPAGTTFVTNTGTVTHPTYTSLTASDNFSSQSYSNNSSQWATNWVESGDSSGATGGSILVTSGRLSVSNANRSIARGVNLSDAIAATLTFNYQRNSMETGDSMIVEVQPAGSSTWTTLLTIVGTGSNDSSAVNSPSLDLLPFASSNTQIRIRTAVNQSNDTVTFDNFVVSYTRRSTTTLTNRTLPTLVSGVTLRPGDQITASFQVRTLSPMTAGLFAITNTATASGTGVPNISTVRVDPIGATLTGSVFEDLNANGVRDAGEPAVAGIPVLVTTQAGPVVGETNANGVYTVTVPTGTVTANVDEGRAPFASAYVTTLDPQSRTVTGGGVTTVNDVGLARATSTGFSPGKTGDATITTAGTVVNRYAAIDGCAPVGATSLRVTGIGDLGALAPGDLLLIYSAQGAAINTANTFNYGAISDLGAAGTYEFVTIRNVPPITGDPLEIQTIELDSGCGGLQNSYCGASGGQVIWVPQYANLTVADGASIEALAWDGSRGGVVSFFVRDTLTLNATGAVSATARGFRGGVQISTEAPNGQTAYATLDQNVGAQKGEGVAGWPAERGRGAAANGGGGGNSHNAGGGGGANGDNGNGWAIGSPAVNGGQGVMDLSGTNPTAWMLDPTYAQNGNQFANSAGGGRGGYSWSNRSANPLLVPPGDSRWGNENGPTNYTGDGRRQVGGLGGRPLANNPRTRLFLGGGGGAGHANNNAGSSGGRGGGLVLVVANNIVGTGTIEARGQQGQDGGTGRNASGQSVDNDAPGGGGAGGTVVLRANRIAPTLNIVADGGRGGDQTWADPTGNAEAEGPGGGGGGGYIAVSNGAPNRSAAGGRSGLNNKSFMAPFPPNGATNGATGQASEQASLLALCAGTITGRVFADLNGNGIQDAGESGLPNVTLLVTLASGGTMTITTDANGSYDILVPPGTTTVSVTGGLPTAAFITTGLPGGNATQTIEVVSGANTAAASIGYQQRGTVTGTVFTDENANASLNAGEPGIGGITVTITPAIGAPIVVETDSNGVYTASVPLGPATITVNTADTDLPAGATLTSPNDLSRTVLVGSVAPAANFGFIPRGTITGVVYLDTNGNGTQDAGEPGIEGATIVITDDFGTTYTLTTSPSGAYSQAGVPAGSATIAITAGLPAGAVQTEGNNPTTVTVTGGATTNSVDGFQQRGTITGVVYLDTNGNGTQDAGEPGIEGATVVITDDFGTTYTLTTSPSGAYSQSGVPAGSATIAITAGLPAGAVQTEGNNPTTVTVTGGATTNSVDGFQQRGTITGIVYLDTNGNGTQDAGEPGIEGATVVITDDFGTTYTLTTSPSGAYSQSGVPAGSATIAITAGLPAGAVQTEGNNPTTVTVTGGATTNSVDGFQQRGTITGVVYLDTNGNGTQDAGEPGIEGATVVITDDFGTTYTLTTSPSGAYSQSGVPAGSATIAITAGLPAGAVQTEGNNPTTVTVTGGATTNSVDGFQQRGTITGIVYLDTNGNGIQDAGEPGIEGATVVITDDFGTTYTLTTSPSGAYSQAGVPAGLATIAITAGLPAGAVQTEGTNPTTVTVTGGGSTNSVDGFQQRGTITGIVYLDINGDGAQGIDEPGLGGVTVLITNAFDQVTTLTTNPDGSYTLSGVAAGNATVDVVDATLPAGALQTAGNDPTVVTVIPADTVATADGYQVDRGTIAGIVWRDADGDMAQGSGEIGLVGMVVTLTGAGPDGVFGTADDFTRTTAASSTGAYSFTLLPVGAYRVSVDSATLAGGYVLTTSATTLSATLAHGQSVSSLDFGFGQPTLVKSDGTLFDDANGNGQLDSGDTIIFVITLTNVSTTTGFSVSIEDVIPAGFSLLDILSAPLSDRSGTTSSFVRLSSINALPSDVITVIYTIVPCVDAADGITASESACADVFEDGMTDLCDAGVISAVANTAGAASYPAYCSLTYEVGLYAGNGWPGYSGDNIPAANDGKLFNPYQAAVDGENNLYIADHSNHVVRKVDAVTGIITTVAGTPGTPGYVGDGGQATSARLRLPADVFVRGYDLYIADKGNNVIRKVDMIDGTITTVAGSGLQGFAGDGGAATAAQLNRPNAVYTDVAGNIYIADTFNFAIRRVDAASGVITTIAGTGGVHGHGPDGSPALNSPLEWVMDLAMTTGCEGDILYFSEQNGYNLIRRIVNGNYETIIGREGSSAFGDCGPAKLAELRRPVGITFDTLGNLYIADRDNHKIRRVDMASGLVTTVVGTGVAGKGAVGGLGTDTQLNTPNGVTVGTNNVLYVVDTANHRVLSVDLNDERQPAHPAFPGVTPNAVTTLMGTGTPGWAGDGMLATAARLDHPARIAFDEAGNMIVADFSAHRIRIVYAFNSRSRTLAGTGRAGYTGDGGAADFAQVSFPVDVATAPGRIYFTDQGNRVVRVINTVNGTISTLATPGFEFVQPDGIARLGETLFVSDRQLGVVVSIDIATGEVTPLASGLVSPRGLAVEPTGAVLVAELGLHRIVRLAEGAVSVVAGNGFMRLAGDGGPATAASLAQPMDVEVAADGTILVADTRNNAIRAISPAGIITTVVGTGAAGFNGDGLAPRDTTLNNPWGVTLDRNGNIVIADRLNHRIRIAGTVE